MFPNMMGWGWHAHGRRWHEGHGHGRHGGHGGPEGDGGNFGVRRPLRFLAHRLNLDEKQVAELARIVDELKTERAQVDVDERRTASAFADAIASETLDTGKLTEAAAARVRSAERLRDAVVKAIGQIHGLLDAEQREHLAFLVRTGVVSF